MPINDIIAGVRQRPDYSTSEPPEENNAPPETPKQTTLRTAEMLPPYLHIETVKDDPFTFLAMAGTVFSLGRLVAFFD